MALLIPIEINYHLSSVYLERKPFVMHKQLLLKSMRVHVQVGHRTQSSFIFQAHQNLTKRRTRTKLQLVIVLNALLYNAKFLLAPVAKEHVGVQDTA